MRALLCAASLAACCAFAAAPDGPQGDSERAKTSFESICAVCHGAKGEGGIGLPLKGIADRLTLEQTIEKIKNPNPAMPKLYPEVLSEDDVAGLAAYIRSLR
jgi:mono/diheme cytochrome c family protein